MTLWIKLPQNGQMTWQFLRFKFVTRFGSVFGILSYFSWQLNFPGASIKFQEISGISSNCRRPVLLNMTVPWSCRVFSWRGTSWFPCAVPALLDRTNPCPASYFGRSRWSTLCSTPNHMYMPVNNVTGLEAGHRVTGSPGVTRSRHVFAITKGS